VHTVRQTDASGPRSRAASRPLTAGAAVIRAVSMLVCTYVLWAGLLLAGAGPAAAHNVLLATDPEEGATLPAPPELITLTFDDEVLTVGTVLEVTSPDGLVELPAPQVADSTVTQQLPGRLPSGDYSVAWRVTSADGHPLEGTLTFGVVATPGSPSTSSTPGAPSATRTATRVENAEDSADVTDDAGISPLVWTIGGVAVVVIVATAWFTARRNHSR
jgi:copper resistance protein C